MKTVSIFWKNDSSELTLLPDVRVATCGGHGMQVVGTDEAIGALVETVNDNPEALWTDGPAVEATTMDMENAVMLSRGNWPEFEGMDDLRQWLNS